MPDAAEILEFWFGKGSVVTAEIQRRWFSADQEFDQLCNEGFLADHAAATAGRLEGWRSDPHSCLALVLLLDQFPRNLFRNTARAFATDAQALAVARGAIAKGYDRELVPLRRVFLYMPFEHSETLADQDESVSLTRNLAQQHPECAGFLKYAEAHREVIRRFGRFPHRNALLGRASSSAEEEYLRDHRGF
jgi:uncharacterized protein (DUF924 family)